ncbi:MAG: hypothetical protein M1839_006462 [Geoglossum umbratile]|nr:MAG: hypothetical protein M1839_006462 [Geoglossum umbratile]
MAIGSSNRNRNALALIALFSASASFLVAAQTQQCYYPNGAVAKDYTYAVCNSTTTQSACCIPSEGDVCLSNDLCYWPSGNYPFRGACTDKSWTSDACPKYCLDVDQTGWVELEVCGGGKFCCGPGCCSAGTTFAVDPAVVVNTFGKAGVIVPGSILGSGSVPSKSASASASASATSAVTATSGSPSATGASGTVTLASTSTSTPVPSSNSSTKTIAVGVGVGVGVGLIFAAVLAFFCYRHFRKNPKPAAAVAVPQQAFVAPPAPPPSQHQAYVPLPQQSQPYPAYPPQDQQQIYPAGQQQQQYPGYYQQPHQLQHQYPGSPVSPAPPYYPPQPLDAKAAPPAKVPEPTPAAIEMDAAGVNRGGEK